VAAPVAAVEQAPKKAVPTGGDFDMATVQELLDDMVRPALQSDGGDITLVKVENNDVFVRLVGACQSCPSSVMTMKNGIERLMREELPNFGELVQLGDYDM
jgi:Fe-S cluster biogenesis protein NfuA